MVDTRDKEETMFPQIRIILLVSVGSFLQGQLFCWTSPFLVQIVNDKVNYNMNEEEASYLAVIAPFSMALFCAPSTKLCDIIGRKTTLMLIAIPQVFFWILTAVGRTPSTFYVARVMSGIGDAILFTSLPMYVGEIASPKIRGTWGNLVAVFLYVGQTVINILGYYFTIWETAYISIPLSIIYLISLNFIPESPYYYILKEKYEDAEDALRTLKGRRNVEEDFLTLKAAVQKQLYEAGTWKDLIMIHRYRKGLIAGLFLRISQQLAAMSVFMVYTQIIFERSGTQLSSAICSILYSTVSCVLTGVSSIVIDRVGRKLSYVISILGCGLALILESVYFYIDQHHLEVGISAFSWIPLLGLVVYILFSSFGLTSIPTLMLGELFATNVKVKGLTILTTTFGLMMFISNRLFYILKLWLGFYGPFLFYGCCAIISAVLSIYIIPETSGKTLEQIQEEYESNKGEQECIKL